MTDPKTLTLAEMVAKGYMLEVTADGTITLTPPDPDEPYREAYAAYRKQLHLSVLGPRTITDEDCIAGLRAAWPHMPETIALQAKLSEAVQLIDNWHRNYDLDGRIEAEMSAFLAKHKDPSR